MRWGLYGVTGRRDQAGRADATALIAHVAV